MAHAHEKGVIHRDLKPSNILVEPSGIPKLIDFGIARSIDTTSEPATALTDVGQALGTIQYMSPEQFAADPSAIDAAADVYAIGVILYELLTGKTPYDVRRKPIHESAKVVQLQAIVPPSQANPRIPPDVAGVIEKCLRKDRTQRFANAVELTRAFDRRQVGEPGPARVLQRPSQLERADSSPPPSVSVQGEEVLACPHCERVFKFSPVVLGKKIRCRGCRQIFHVPKDTSSVPLSRSSPTAGGRDTAPPIAAKCEVDGQDARRCPECGRIFIMRPKFTEKKIRCRACKVMFRVTASDVPTEASVLTAESLPAAPRPTIFDDIGDILDELGPGESVASVVRPQIAARRKPFESSGRLPNPFLRPFI
jgi:serine/threonine protein kinase